MLATTVGRGDRSGEHAAVGRHAGEDQQAKPAPDPFAGTERAVYVSFDDGDHWQSLRQNLPSTRLLDLDETLQELGESLKNNVNANVLGQVVQINPGPVVTTFEYKPEAGIKYSRITNLTDDLCLALKAESILIERMAGKGLGNPKASSIVSSRTSPSWSRRRSGRAPA